MQDANVEGVLFVLGLLAAAATFIGAVFAANAVLAPRNPTALKLEPYECGIPQAGEAWAAVRLRYAGMALLLVVLDAGAALLFAVAPALRGSPGNAAAAGVVAALAALGLFYAWRKGALEWR